MRLILTLALFLFTLTQLCYAADTVLVDRADQTVPYDLTPVQQGAALGATALQPASVVNDLTTGGVAVPLSAEQGKTLQSTKQGNLADTSGVEINTTGAGDRNGVIDLHASDLAAQSDYSSRIIRSNGDGGLRFFNRYANSNPAGSYAFYFSSDNASAGNSGGAVQVANGGLFHRITAPSYAWNMWPAAEHSVEFPKLGVGGANQGFAQWLVTAGPDPADVTANSPGSDWGIIGQEINTFERSADAGYMESRTGRWSVGTQIVPESELSIFGGSPQQGYHGSFGILLGRSTTAAPRTFPAAKWHVPLTVQQDATAPGGTSVLLRGGSDASNDPNIAVKVMDYQNIGIDTSSATMASDAIRLGPTQTIGDGTNSYTLTQLAEAGSAGVPASTVTTQAFGDTGTVGVDTDYAREDHKHVMPANPLTTTSTSASSGVALSRAQPDLETANRYSVTTINYTATDATPAVGASVAGVDINAQYSGSNGAGNTLDAVYGAFLSARNTGTGKVDYLGNYSWLRNTSSGTVKYLDNFYAKAPTNAGTIASGGRGTGFFAENQGLSGMTNSYGLYLANQSGATNSYSIYTGTSTHGASFGDQIVSRLSTGTAPLAVASTTLNTNLNADYLDGQHGSYYAPLNGATHAQGTSTTLDLNANDGFRITAASGTVTLTVNNLVDGKYFDIEVISSSGALTLNAPLFTGATFLNGNNSTTVSAGKKSHYVCKGNGSGTALCYILAESKP